MTEPGDPGVDPGADADPDRLRRPPADLTERALLLEQVEAELRTALGALDAR